MTASVRPHSLSVHEADSLTCDHLSNRPSYCQNNPYNDETFDESFHTGDYLFIWGYWVNIGSTSRKAPAFLQGLFSSSSVGAGDGDRTRDPLLGKQAGDIVFREFRVKVVQFVDTQNSYQQSRIMNGNAVPIYIQFSRNYSRSNGSFVCCAISAS